MMMLSSSLIRQGLQTQTFGHTVEYFPATNSTNTILKALAEEGAPEGTLCITDDQTAGRGRFERQWHIPAESSLPMSLLFRPTFLAAPYVPQLTMLCALAVREAILAETGLTIGLKWPNDLIYQDKKLAGILTEASFQGEKIDWVVVGVGLNVNIEAAFFAQTMTGEQEPLSQVATSLQLILGHPVSRLALLQAYLLAVENRYHRLAAGRSPLAEWAANLDTLGSWVTVIEKQGRYRAFAESVTETGLLQVRLEDDTIRNVMAGDVSLRSSR